LKDTQKIILHAIYRAPVLYGNRYFKANDLAIASGVTYRNITKSLQKFRQKGWLKTSFQVQRKHLGNQVTFIHPAVEKYLQNLPADYSDIPEPKSLLKNKKNTKVSFFEKDSENPDEKDSETSKSKDDFWTEFRADFRYEYFDHFYPNFAQWDFGIKNIEDALQKRKFLPETSEMIWEEIDRLNYFANTPTMRKKAQKGKEAGFLFVCFLNNRFATPDWISQSEIQRMELEKWEKRYADLQARLQKMDAQRKHEKILLRIEALADEQLENLRAILLMPVEDSSELILKNHQIEQILRLEKADPNFWDKL
jgi:hypothetical protein